MMNLFSRFRSLFRKSDETYDDYSDVAVAEMDEPQPSYPGAPGRTGASLRVAQGSRAFTPLAARNLEIPLAPMLAELPLELQGRVVTPEVDDISVHLPLQTVLPQLAKGGVTVSFGELRRSAPEVFTNQRDQDAVQVTVPLAVILPRLSPELLARKQGRQQMEIPDDIVSPFADKGKGLVVARKASQPAAARPAIPKPVAPKPVIPKHPSGALPHVSPAARVNPGVPQRTGLPGVPTRPAVPKTRPLSSTSHMLRPAGNPSVSPTPNTVAMPPSIPSAPEKPPAQPAKKPTPPSAPIPMSGTPGAHIRMPSSGPISANTNKAPQTISPVVPQPEPEQPALPASGNGTGKFLRLSVSAVADAWPDALKHEIVQLGLAESDIAVPFDQVEAGLKRGRLAFAWKIIRSWITQGQLTGVSIHDATELELPLRVVAPLFIKYQKEAGQSKPKVAVDKDIPNLFFGGSQSDAAEQARDHSVTRPMDTNFYVWDDTNDTLNEEASDSLGAYARTGGTEFITRCATPNEVVSRAAALDGVEGALIALPDGLMVANNLPEGHNGDTLAAFLPHLFGKVTQCTQELRMGELNNLNFTVGNVPWKIFRVNALYFAAFGHKGKPLPTAQLAALAGELDHKVKS